MPTQESIPLGAPNWLDLATSDLAAAQAFYSTLFGWTYESGGGGYVFCLKNGSQVAGMMQNSDDSEFPDGWTTYFASDDAQATCDLADESGGQSAIQPTEVSGMGTMALLVDPGGASVGVWQGAEHRGFQLIGEPGSAVWHELYTRHYRSSVLFYELVFGWNTTVLSDTDEFRYTTAEFDGRSLAGIMDATALIDEDTPASWQVYFGVDDVDATLALAETAGGRIINPAQDSAYGRLGTLADPTGARLMVMAPSE
jgi:predicted enzyme related to lactoylglutathione lyase